VAESLADIRADRIIGDARREAQAIVDAARVDARREARTIVDAARAEAEGIITEAFEQRARIVRRDWAIGDGDWTGGADADGDEASDGGGNNDDGKADGTLGPEPGIDTPGSEPEIPAAETATRADGPDRVADLSPAAALAELLESPPSPADDPSRPVPSPSRPEVRQEPSQRPPPPLSSRYRRGAPARARDLAGRLAPVPPPPPPPDPPEVVSPSEVSPPPSRFLPALPRRPAAPPPAPPAQTPPRRPRPRVERELPAGMRIPPDVPDWDDDYDDGDER
jgi:hypothetical protein